MRLTYMLDANVLVHLANKAEGWERIESRFKDTPFDALCMSSIAFFELSAMRGLILVTDNTKEFERVPLLKLENWRLH